MNIRAEWRRRLVRQQMVRAANASRGKRVDELARLELLEGTFEVAERFEPGAQLGLPLLPTT